MQLRKVQCLKNLSLVVCILLCSVTWAAKEEITLNGLLGDKAIISLNGKPKIYYKGKKKKGITLLKVHDGSAVFDIRGKRVTLFMKEIFSGNPKFKKEINKGGKAKSHIVSAKLVWQTDTLLQYEIDYFYDGSKGDLVTLVAKPYFLGSTAEFWRHTYLKVKTGRNIETIKITLMPDYKGQALSDSVRFELRWAQEGRSGVIDEYRTSLLKEWKQ